MHISGFFHRLGLTGAWARELGLAAIALLVGFALMPVLIFFAGSMILGRYEGASVSRIYDAVYGGLGGGSMAAWGVVLGPYVLYLVFVSLRTWWRASAKMA